MVVVVAVGAARRGAGMAGVAARSTGTAGGCTAGVVAAAAARSTAPRRPTLTSQQPTHSTCETNIEIKKQKRYFLRKYLLCVYLYNGVLFCSCLLIIINHVSCYEFVWFCKTITSQLK